MGNSLTDLTAEVSEGVDGSSRTCRIGVVEVEDRFTPTPGSLLLSSAELRALRAGAACNQATGTAIRFHTSVWDALGGPCAPPAQVPSPAPHTSVSGSGAAAAPATAEPAPVPYAVAQARSFSPELWYAQAASLGLHQKQSQLSFRALKERPKTAPSEWQ